MAEYETDFESTLERMENRVDADISKGEGTLINFALAPAAAELEELHNEIEINDLNGSPITCDREHLIMFGQCNNVPIKTATNAVWLAQFNVDFEVGERFETGDYTYISTQKIEDKKYYLECEQSGSVGNVKPADELVPVDYIEDYEFGELIELIQEATDDEDTEVFRNRYLLERKQGSAVSGNRAWYQKLIKAEYGVGGVKLERMTDGRRRINAYVISSGFTKPADEVITALQNVIDPIGKQGDGAGEALIFHVVDIKAVEEVTINVSGTFELQSGIIFDDILGDLQAAVDNYINELNRTWETEEYLTVRLLRISEAMAEVSGVIDITDVKLNGVGDNIVLGAYEIPVRGVIEC